MVENIRYKLVALDLDGTLLNSQGQLSTKHIEAVRKVRNAGVQVLIATGRYFMQTLRIIEELNYDGILVLNDGAELYERLSAANVKLEPLRNENDEGLTFVYTDPQGNKFQVW